MVGAVSLELKLHALASETTADLPPSTAVQRNARAYPLECDPLSAAVRVSVSARWLLVLSPAPPWRLPWWTHAGERTCVYIGFIEPLVRVELEPLVFRLFRQRNHARFLRLQNLLDLRSLCLRKGQLAFNSANHNSREASLHPAILILQSGCGCDHSKAKSACSGRHDPA